MDHTSVHNLMVKTKTKTEDGKKAAPDFSRARMVMASPHIVDLSPSIPKPSEENQRNPYHGHSLAWFHRLLDQKIHLRDFNARTVSIRERGWRDFPPAGAVTLAQAVVITVKRFFEDHPLANITFLSILHLAFLAAWHFVAQPDEEHDRSETADRLMAAPMMVVKQPVIAAVIPEATETRAIPEEPERERRRWAWPKLSLEIQAGWHASVLSFAVIAMLVILPVGAYGSLRTEGLSIRSLVDTGVSSTKSLNRALEAVTTMDFTTANSEFQEAQSGFQAISNGLGGFGRAVSFAAGLLPANSQLSALSPLVEVGREASAGGAVITSTLSRLKENQDLPMTEKIRLLSAGLAEATPYFENANHFLDQVNPEDVPEEFRDKVALAKEELPRALSMMHDAVPALDFLVPLLGGTGPRRYLVVFQNNAEIRPTGGFIGSFALVDLNQGEIESMDIPGGGSYDLQGQQTLKVESPQPLHLINPHWEFQDSNWYPDFPTSAQLISRFYERAGGPTPDGVIAVNASFMVKLLEAFGPIEMDGYDKTITADNFFLETQKSVELEYDKEENKPKQFLADMAPKILEKVRSMDTGLAASLGAEALNALSARDIQIWLNVPDEQEQLTAMGWDGGIMKAPQDYLQVVHTNIAGQKTDIVMHDSLSHNAKIMPDGTVIGTVTLTREHRGEKGSLFSGVRNVDYVRFYVPAGSELVNASGFESPDPSLFKIAEGEYGAEENLEREEANSRFDRDSGTRIGTEGDKTVFGNWMQTDPGKSTTVKVTYRVPAGRAVRFHYPNTETWQSKLNDFMGQEEKPTLSYSLNVQKQSGLNPIEFTSSIEVPFGWQVTEQVPGLNFDDQGRFVSSLTLSKDGVFGVKAEAFSR